MSLIRYTGQNLQPLNEESLKVDNKVIYDNQNLMIVPEDGNKYLYLVDDNSRVFDVNVIIDDEALPLYDEVFLTNKRHVDLLDSDPRLIYQGDLEHHYDSTDHCYYALLELDSPILVDNLHLYDVYSEYRIVGQSDTVTTYHNIEFSPGYVVSPTKTILYTFQVNPPEVNFTITCEMYIENDTYYLSSTYLNPYDLGDIDVHMDIYETGWVEYPVVYRRDIQFQADGQSTGIIGTGLNSPFLNTIIDETKYYQISIIEDPSAQADKIYKNVRFIDSRQTQGSVLVYSGVLSQDGNSVEAPTLDNPLAIWTNDNSGDLTDTVWLWTAGDLSLVGNAIVEIRLVGDHPQAVYDESWTFTRQSAGFYSYKYGADVYAGLEGVVADQFYDVHIENEVFKNVKLIAGDDPTEQVMYYGEDPVTYSNPLFINWYVASGDWYTTIKFYTEEYYGITFNTRVKFYPSENVQTRSSTPALVREGLAPTKQDVFQIFKISELEKDSETGNYILPVNLDIFESDVVYCYLAKRDVNYKYMFSQPCKFYILFNRDIPVPDETAGHFLQLAQPFCSSASCEQEDVITPLFIAQLSGYVLDGAYAVSTGKPIIDQITGYGYSFNLFENGYTPCYADTIVYKHIASDQLLYRTLPDPQEYLTFSANHPFKISYRSDAPNHIYACSQDSYNWKVMKDSVESSDVYSVTNCIYLTGWYVNNVNDYLESLDIQPIDSNDTDLQVTISGNLACLGNPDDLSLPLDSLALFGYNSSIYSIADLVIPSTMVCKEMFASCESLIDVPTIEYNLNVPLKDRQFIHMFAGCTSLVDVSSLDFPDVQLSFGCYQYMFSNSGVRIPPILQSTQPANYCYRYMFADSQVALSTEQEGDYTEEFRIPSTGTIDSTTYPSSNIADSMFVYTPGSFASTPELNTVYYYSNTFNQEE